MRFFLSLREAFFSSSSNINAIVANFLLENEAAYLMEISAGLLSRAMPEGDWTGQTVWTQTNLMERKRDV